MDSFKNETSVETDSLTYKLSEEIYSLMAGLSVEIDSLITDDDMLEHDGVFSLEEGTLPA